jgi:UDP-GlcNAc3NAcA epimerase
MISLLTVVGARPQFIKASMLSRTIASTEGVTEVLVHTGQHFDAEMSDVFFNELDMSAPVHNLGIGGGTHGQNTGRMIEAIEGVIQQQKPTAVLVYGDTDTTLAAALAAAKLHKPVIHVEAGLRSYNMSMPEEINRRLTDHVSTLLLAPTTRAVENLLGEGLAATAIHNVGDIMFDVALHFGAIAEMRSGILADLGLSRQQYALATLHRQENTDDKSRLERLLRALGGCGYRVVLPLHPRTKRRISEFGIIVPSSVNVIGPVGYLDMAMLEKNATFIATDSGGVQKEAFFHGVPCITLRTETEWVELVETGWNRLVSPTSEALDSAFLDLAVGQSDFSPYGDGNAAAKILAVVKSAFA